MKILAALLSRKMPTEPVPFQEILPLRLKSRVSGKGDNQSDVCCIYEMSVMFACLKEHEFNQSLCGKEIEKFQKCYLEYSTKRRTRKEKEAKGSIIMGERDFSHKQLNRMLKNFPQK